VTAIPTNGPRSAATIARECIEKGAELILAAGGDGTINEVANGMIGNAIPLAILPGGTANVLATELGVGRGMPQAAVGLASLTPRRIAVGRIENAQEERHFLMMAGAGLDAMIVYNIDANLKASLGKVAYWVSGFGQVGRALPEFDVRLDGRKIRCSFALASRVKNYGGDLSIARNASLFSNEFEVVLFQGANSWPYMKYLTGVVTGRLTNMRGVEVLRAHSLEIECATDPGIYVQVDGEFAGRLPARLSIVQDALTLLVPERFLQQHTR
jgi:YegS/Rv2252/BmrU family lipid kinase